jgi:hypothetical protein
LLLAFNLGRALDVFSGHLSKLSFRFRVHDPACVPRQFVGLISQIDGAFGHSGTLAHQAKTRCLILLTLARFSCGQSRIEFGRGDDPHGTLCENIHPPRSPMIASSVAACPPVFGVLLLARQAGHVFDGIAQRHKRLARPWYGNRFEKFQVPRHYATRYQLMRLLKSITSLQFSLVST